MTTDPERLLHAVGTEPAERELLASVRDVHAPGGAKERVWSGIAGELAAGVMVGTVAGTAAATSTATAKGGTLALGTHAFAVKAGAALLVGGLAAGGYVALKGEGTPAAPGVVPAARTATSTAPPLPRVEMAPAPISPPPAPSEMPAQRARESDRRASLAAESALLTEARAKLRSGDANGAAETLERLRARFPRGVLGQEREVLAIEILMAQGSRDAAKTRARAFIRSYPRSPHVEKLGRLVDEP